MSTAQKLQILVQKFETMTSRNGQSRTKKVMKYAKFTGETREQRMNEIIASYAKR